MATERTQKQVINDIYDKLATFDFDKWNKFLALQEEKNKIIDDLKHDVYGNGQVGICENVRKLARDIGIFKWVAITVGGAFISGVMKLWLDGTLAQLFN